MINTSRLLFKIPLYPVSL